MGKKSASPALCGKEPIKSHIFNKTYIYLDVNIKHLAHQSGQNMQDEDKKNAHN